MEIKIKVFPKQRQALEILESSDKTEVVYGGAAGGGKSVVIAIWLILNCMRYPGTRWLIGRNQLSKLKKSTLLTIFETMREHFDMQPDVDYKYNSQDGIIYILKYDSSIYLMDLAYQPSDPNYDRLGSTEFTGAAIDEVQEVEQKAKDVLMGRLRFKTKKYKIKGKLLMTCNPSKNWLYTNYYQPYVNGTLQSHQAFLPSLVTDNPFIDPNYIESLKRIADETTRQRLLYGNWDYEDSTNQLVAYQWLQSALVDTVPQGGIKRLGVDIAREGNDKSVMALVHEVDGVSYLEGVEEISVPITQATDISGEIRAEIWAYAIANQIGYENIYLDAIGVGSGVVDSFRSKELLVHSYKAGNRVDVEDEFTSYKNLRAYSYWNLRILLQEGKFKIFKTIKNLDALLTELMAHTYEIDAKQVIIESKDKIKKAIGRSPDFADAVVIATVPEVKSNYEFYVGTI